jgi:5-methylcytosine-specific restriction endonuclease McrA
LQSPVVIRLRYMVKVPYQRSTTMSRRAVFARDNHICGYCGGTADSIDHVMPRSRGGKNEWDNVIAACRGCNLRKRDRTPEEAGMKPHVSCPGLCIRFLVFLRSGSRTWLAPVKTARVEP